MKSVVQSRELVRYTLPKALVAVLHRFDQMRTWMQLGGRPTPDAVRLYKDDYKKFDKLIRTQSAGVYDASKVVYNGLPLIPADEQKKPFTLETP